MNLNLGMMTFMESFMMLLIMLLASCSRRLSILKVLDSFSILMVGVAVVVDVVVVVLVSLLVLVSL